MEELYHKYNKRLKTMARDLRSNSTKAEIRLWAELLRAGKMKGFSFNRQRPISKYIVDFYCPKLKLVIEVDGWTHEDPEIMVKDELKQKELQELGCRVL